VVSLNRLSFDAVTLFVVSFVSNFFHSPVRPEIFLLANVVLPSALSRLTVTGPLKPGAAFAKNETV